MSENVNAAYDVLNELVPLDSQSLAQQVDVDQLNAIKVVIEERIAELLAAEKDAEEQGGGARKKSRWDSDSEDDEVKQKKQRQKKSKRKNTVTYRSLSCTNCRSIDNYTLETRLSEGVYGVVWRGVDKETKEMVALKKIKLDSDSEPEQWYNGCPQTALRETSILMDLKHPNIIRIREMVVGPREEDESIKGQEEPYPQFEVYMVMDYWSRDLHSIMNDCLDRPFYQSEVKLIMRQILEALAYMHEHWYMHRDLKPQNILYGHGGRIAICDFGFARPFDIPPAEPYTNEVVTLTYRAPEVLLGAVEYDGRAVDIWSVGCIFAELLTKTALLPGTTDAEQLNRIWHMLGTPVAEAEPMSRSWPDFEKQISGKELSMLNQPICRLREVIPAYNPVAPHEAYLTDVGLDLLLNMLALNPANRMLARDCLMHDWIVRELPSEKKVGEMPNFDS